MKHTGLLEGTYTTHKLTFLIAPAAQEPHWWVHTRFFGEEPCVDIQIQIFHHLSKDHIKLVRQRSVPVNKAGWNKSLASQSDSIFKWSWKKQIDYSDNTNYCVYNNIKSLSSKVAAWDDFFVACFVDFWDCLAISCPHLCCSSFSSAFSILFISLFSSFSFLFF